ncbi:MAG: SCO family protein [Pseudomonadota bacterium]|nr:SCO family protein [Pseudomonadota bacterium]
MNPSSNWRSALSRLAVLGLLAGVAGLAGAGEAAAPTVATDPAQGKVSQHRIAVHLPPVALVRADGKPVSVPQEFDDGRALMVNFIYTTCFGICPISSQTFAQLQGLLGSDAAKVHLVSVSLDPEEDTPPVLREYARKYHAGPGWDHYTGTVEASIAVQKAFSVYKGDKMNHDPVTLIRAAPGAPWVRVDGFATARELARIYRSLAAAG